jgi:hypothetical protein
MPKATEVEPGHYKIPVGGGSSSEQNFPATLRDPEICDHKRTRFTISGGWGCLDCGIPLSTADVAEIDNKKLISVPYEKAEMAAVLGLVASPTHVYYPDKGEFRTGIQGWIRKVNPNTRRVKFEDQHANVHFVKANQVKEIKRA